ncbi:uncharacterized protein LOC132706482 [Cylas formicarius]|uniref:uncharacterized protein LOC132706482 n=1 Tax=Cylas formicarius TaxID=197179 RepID=UPI002958A32C|nr:uncharacterized protein LOC132706482 [Cylas formicarius]
MWFKFKESFPVNSFLKMESRKELFRFVIITLKLAGMWRLDISHCSKLSAYFYMIYYIILTVISFYFTISMAIDIPYILRTDPEAAIDSISKLIYLALLLVKVVFYPRISKEILLQAMSYERYIYMQNDSATLRIYSKHVKFSHVLSKFLCTTTLFTAIAFCGFGILNSYKFHRLQRHANNTLQKPLPFLIWYPYDENRYHVWALTQQSISMFVLTNFIITTQIFNNCVIIFIRSQLIIFQNYFRHFDQY